MSRINEIAAASAAAVDSVHEERVRLLPMIMHQHGGRLPDPSRPEATITAPLIIESGMDALDTRGRGDVARFGNGAAMLRVRKEIWPEATGLKKGDVIEALDRDGVPRFAVDSVDTRPRVRNHVHTVGTEPCLTALRCVCVPFTP